MDVLILTAARGSDGGSSIYIAVRGSDGCPILTAARDSDGGSSIAVRGSDGGSSLAVRGSDGCFYTHSSEGF